MCGVFLGMQGKRDNGGRSTAARRVFDPAGRWRAAAVLAARQYGVVSRRQLLALGIGSGAIEHWLRTGHLHPIRRGVYLLGHRAAPPQAHLKAALLVCGDGAVLSHASAGRLWHLLPRRLDAAPIDVTVVARNPGPKRGIRLHRISTLRAADVRSLERLALTAPARTMLDLAPGSGRDDLECRLAEALARRLLRRADLLAAVEAYPRHPGAARLLSCLDAGSGPALTRSEAERKLLALIRRAELPTPEANARLFGYEVDFLWRSEQVVVEVDGFRFHSSRQSFESDRVRDVELAARGFRVLRVTWRELTERPERFLARLARTLASAG